MVVRSHHVSNTVNKHIVSKYYLEISHIRDHFIPTSGNEISDLQLDYN